MDNVRIGKRLVGDGNPVYVIAEVGSNHDGKLDKAKTLADLAKKSGADAIKFQSFLAPKIVCRQGFESMGSRLSFQSKWKKSVYQTYKDAEFPREWHAEIAGHCRKIGIDFMSAPYDREAVDLLDGIGVPAFKIGSGDINFLSLIKYIAEKGRPIMLATGASTMDEIEEAVQAIRSTGNEQIILLQCITNYPSPVEQANIRAMATLRQRFNANVGYSDHSLGDIVPLAAVALGACVIEKHFTEDKSMDGPDHPFAMDVSEFSGMVRSIRMLEKALGTGEKKPVEAEKETIILQKRCIYAAADIPRGARITADMLAVLRPDLGIKPKYFDSVVGSKALADIKCGEPLTWQKVSKGGMA